MCGPVVDIELQIKAKYGERMAFIHQEVYVDNEVNKSLRHRCAPSASKPSPGCSPSTQAAASPARLEGSFGVHAFEEAIKAAL